MDSAYQERFELTRAVALSAGNLIAYLRRSGDFSQHYKSSRNPVTSADLAAEQLILGEIRSAFPNDRILSEETCANQD